MRSRLLVALAGALLVALTWSFPLWRPLVMDDVVDEAFHGLRADMLDEFRQLGEFERESLLQLAREDPAMARSMLEAALQPPVLVEEAQQSVSILLARGNFVRIDPLHWAQGDALVYTRPNGSHVLRLENFRAANGPDLRVMLSASPAPRSPAELNEGGLALDLGRLKGNAGNQNYAIPAAVDPGLYNSIVIFCRRFNLVFSSATL
ncbi:MAG: DM13 domain-containing protein [Anaerolineaceae bacterium]|nr:DM13 domain-containing protein [Anaerolineaceae bacterium]